MTQSQTFRFKLLMGVYATAAAVGGSTNPLAWNVYGKAMGAIVLGILVVHQYKMFKVEKLFREGDEE
jgi:hypothetical protein